MPGDVIAVQAEDGLIYALDTLHRHLLYCADDQRVVSAKYDPLEVDIYRAMLVEWGLLEDVSGVLTASGTDVVDRLRKRREGG